MPMSLEEIFSEAKILPNDSKAILAEKLIASIEDDIDPQVTKSHLMEVKKRRDEIRSGKVVPINGEEPSNLAAPESIFQSGIHVFNRNSRLLIFG